MGSGLVGVSGVLRDRTRRRIGRDGIRDTEGKATGLEAGSSTGVTRDQNGRDLLVEVPGSYHPLKRTPGSSYEDMSFRDSKER